MRFARTLAALFVLMGTILCADYVWAENWYKRLTPKQTADEMYSLTIKVEPIKSGAPSFEGKADAGQFLEFHVAVRPTVPSKDFPQDLHHSGEFRIFNGKDYIASSKVQMIESEEGWSFSFKIARKYAEKSGFVFAATDAEGQGAHYWFYFQDFLPPK
jgi:hypothetical protein